MIDAMNPRAAVLIVLAAAVLVAAYFVLRPSDDDTSDAPPATVAATQPQTVEDTPTATAPQATTTTAPPTTTTTPPKPKIPTIRIEDGAPVGGVKEIEVDKGDTIAFKVTADAPGGEVHLHGYDVSKEIPASGGSVTFRVPATVEGIFEAELEATGVHIAKVTVQP